MSTLLGQFFGGALGDVIRKESEASALERVIKSTPEEEKSVYAREFPWLSQNGQAASQNIMQERQNARLLKEQGLLAKDSPIDMIGNAIVSKLPALQAQKQKQDAQVRSIENQGLRNAYQSGQITRDQYFSALNEDERKAEVDNEYKESLVKLNTAKAEKADVETANIEKNKEKEEKGNRNFAKWLSGEKEELTEDEYASLNFKQQELVGMGRLEAKKQKGEAKKEFTKLAIDDYKVAKEAATYADHIQPTYNAAIDHMMRKDPERSPRAILAKFTGNDLFLDTNDRVMIRLGKEQMGDIANVIKGRLTEAEFFFLERGYMNEMMTREAGLSIMAFQQMKSDYNRAIYDEMNRIIDDGGGEIPRDLARQAYLNLDKSGFIGAVVARMGRQIEHIMNMDIDVPKGYGLMLDADGRRQLVKYENIDAVLATGGKLVRKS